MFCTQNTFNTFNTVDTFGTVSLFDTWHSWYLWHFCDMLTCLALCQFQQIWLLKSLVFHTFNIFNTPAKFDQREAPVRWKSCLDSWERRLWLFPAVEEEQLGRPLSWWTPLEPTHIGGLIVIWSWDWNVDLYEHDDQDSLIMMMDSKMVMLQIPWYFSDGAYSSSHCRNLGEFSSPGWLDYWLYGDYENHDL